MDRLVKENEQSEVNRNNMGMKVSGEKGETEGRKGPVVTSPIAGVSQFGGHWTSGGYVPGGGDMRWRDQPYPSRLLLLV